MLVYVGIFSSGYGDILQDEDALRSEIVPVRRRAAFKSLSFCLVKFACQSAWICISSADSSGAPVSAAMVELSRKAGC